MKEEEKTDLLTCVASPQVKRIVYMCNRIKIEPKTIIKLNLKPTLFY